MNGAAAAAAVPYCGAAPAAGEIWSHWNLDPVLIAALGAAALGWLLRGRGGAGASRAFWSGWALLLIAFVSPLCALSSGLFAARSVHHLLLVALAAPLLALALRPRRTPPLGLAVGLHIAALWAWHVPAFYAAALGHHGLYWAMELSLLASAIAFWSAVLRAPAFPAAAGALLGVTVQMGFIGALLVFAPAPLYGPHVATAGLYGLTALEDQQLAGLVMWAIGLAPYLAAAAALAWRRLAPEREAAA